MARLDGKVAVVTGAGRGIGEATVRLMAKEGASVVVADMVDGGATVYLPSTQSDVRRA